MQDFATDKAVAWGRALDKLTCFIPKSSNTVRIMKLTGILLLAACLQLSARGLTQTVTISVKDAPLLSVLKAIEKQTGFVFFADNKQLQKAKKVTLNVNNIPLQQALELCFKDQPLTYTVTGKVINVFPKDEISVTPNNSVLSPPIDIKGRIVDTKGEPISNATVSVKGTLKSTITNANGEFTLKGTDGNAIIIITHVQYETQYISLQGNEVVNATLQIKIGNLDELQVVAYGTTTKRLNTGNVSSVKASDIEKQPVNNPLLALQGRVPGLFVTQSTGLPGAGVTVRIQGKNSITRGNDPLYVIDGVPYSSQLLPTFSDILGRSGGISFDGVAAGGGNPLSFINPADIESIEVLKDADATSIYGSRASNGAILITTKKGKAGKTKVDFNAQHGFGKVSRFLPLLNTEQYLEMRKEALKNDGIQDPDPTDYDINGVWDTTRYTDWQKNLIGGTATYTDVQASVSGGNSNTQFLLGTGYHRETTVYPGDFSDQKKSIHFDINNVSTNQRFRLQFSGSYLSDNNRITTTDLTQQSIILPPTAPALYNEDGTLNWAPSPSGSSTWENPLAFLLTKYRIETTNLIGNLTVGYQILKGLELKSSFGYTKLQSNEISTTPLNAWSPELQTFNPRGASFSYNTIKSWISEPQISYTTNIASGKLEALIGGTILRNNSDVQSINASGYNSDVVLEDIRSASLISPGATADINYKYGALFGRINYVWQDKYIMNLTARRDGSSRFGAENQFHSFGSVATAWIFSKEGFMRQIPFVSFGKLRGNYGTTGNDQIGEYQFMNLYSPPSGVGVPYQNAIGLAPNRLNNPFLQWEETRKLQFGLDLGLLADRLLLTVNYYRNRTSNLLLQYQLPIFTGFLSQTRNFPATVQNTGWEFSLVSSNIKLKDFNWTTNFNLTVPKNKLVEFPTLETSTYVSSLVIGEPIAITKVYHLLGVDPATGIYQFADQAGNPTSNPTFATDANIIVNTLPTLYGGFQNNFSYKGLQLDVLFQFVKQKGGNNAFGNTPGAYYANQPTWVLDRWQKVGDEAPIQKYNADYSISGAFFNVNGSDKGIADASYIRLKNISLSWQLPQSWTRIIKTQNCRLYVLGQNIATITDYKGLDPETLSNSTLPPLRIITFGLHVTL